MWADSGDSGADPAVLKAATWNIRFFSDNSRSQWELLLITAILSRYDFIAIQETRDTEILDRTVRFLHEFFGKQYQHITSPPVGRGMMERYSFLYDTDVVRFQGAQFFIPDLEDRFIREPFAAGFRAGEFDFYAVNVHTIYGDSVEERQAETALLTEAVNHVRLRTGEKDILLMGDFNLPPEDAGFDLLRTAERFLPINTDVPTSIYGKLYDNIWLDPIHTSEYTGRWGVYFFDVLLFDDENRAASLAVSDHCPLWAQFDISGPDDD